jgi:hypothetical protein
MFLLHAMTQGGGKTKRPAGREERLRAALRENLKRRKAQARARAGEEVAPAREAVADRKDGPDFRRNPGRQ